jgi:uroporphyrinogen-III synthase
VPGDREAMTGAVRDLVAGRFAGVCLTSGNGVHALATACVAAAVDPAAAVSSVGFVGAVGSRTAALVADAFGRAPDVVPAVSTGAALGAAVPAGSGPVLLPRGDLASGDLEVALRTAGYDPIGVVAYRTVTADALPAAVLDALAAGEVDLLAFTSASTVHGFVALVGDRPWSGRVVSIGPVTSAACREHHLDVVAEADPHDLDGLLAALLRATP